MKTFLGIAASLACLTLPAAAATPVSEIGVHAFALTVNGQTLRIPYDANQSLAWSTQVVRAVVMIPGSARSSDNAYDTARDAASSAGVNNATSLLLSPQYLVEDDIASHDLPADRLFWDEDGWKEGDPSLSTSGHPRPATISSFAVLDSLLLRIVSLYPNLRTVVIAGHSAGGQFVNRYAAGNRVQPTLESIRGVAVSYVVANAGSYLYLNAKRLAPSLGTFVVPSSPGCSYDRYKYGLQSRSGYMAALTSSQIAAQYRQRRVIYLLGQLDNDPAHPELDVSCSATLQGTSRLDRGRTYMYHLADLYGAAGAASHSKVEVPSVAHDSRDMFTSPCGVSTLFGVGGCASLVDVAEEPPAAPVSTAPSVRLWNEPNPFRGQTRITFALTGGSAATVVKIHDVRGRMVRTLEGVPGAGGTGSVIWDGSGSAGEPLPAGVYFLRVERPEGALTKRVTLLR